MWVKNRLKNLTIGVGLYGLESNILHQLDNSFHDIVRGNGDDIVLAGACYYIARTVGGGGFDNRYISGAYALLGCSTFEIFQALNIYHGTFDKFDFLVYTLGVGIAFGLDKITGDKHTSKNSLFKPI